jgi:hypothetical protein
MRQQVIKDLIAQFCGHPTRLQRYIGAYSMIAKHDGDSPCFGFRFKMCSFANCCKISYNYSSDTYTIEFGQIRGRGCIVTKVFKDEYCNTLTPTFEEYTGLSLYYKPQFVCS